MNFEGFYGNERAKEYISTAFARGSFPHALLIAGDRGIGKRTLSRIIAKTLVCESTDAPCLACDSCAKADKGVHPDIIIIGRDASSIGANVIRDLKRDALLRPNDAERKVYILDNAGAMTHEAQDAFLKILEEPPAFTFFILLCCNYSDLLPTIVSRTAHLTLSPLNDSDMLKIIGEKLPDISDAEAKELIRTSGGICSFLSDDDDTEFLAKTEAIVRALISKDELEIFKAFSAIEKDKKAAVISILDELVVVLRDAIALSSGASLRPLSPLPQNLSKELSELFSPRLSAKLSDLIARAKEDFSRNVGTSHIIGSLICNFAHTAANAALKG